MFSSSENSWFSPSFLKDLFTGDKIVHWLYFFFQHLRNVCHLLLAPCYLWEIFCDSNCFCLRVRCHFSYCFLCLEFSCLLLSLSWIFVHVTDESWYGFLWVYTVWDSLSNPWPNQRWTSVGPNQFPFLLLWEFLWNSWICMFVYFAKLGKFLVIISSGSFF